MFFFDVPQFKPDFKAKLIAALRSGKYRQTHSVLCRLNGEYSFCCLGVACIVNHPNLTMAKLWPKSSNMDNICYFMDDHAFQVPPEDEILSWIIEQGPNLCGDINIGIKDKEYNNITLTSLNDRGCTFDQIADVIEYFL